jgi:O-antigen ligase
MLRRVLTFRMPLAILLCCAFAAYMIFYRPGYLVSAEFLGMLVFVQFVAAVLWSYVTRFFPFLMIAFLLAGTTLPLQGMWTSARWFVLGAGAFAGIAIYLRERQHSFEAFHAVAFFCVVAAAISAQMSAFPGQALLKSSSLFLLFLYGASGARLAADGRTAQFSSTLLLGGELMVYLTAGAYFIVHVKIFGNPNSLGALMGVVASPLMLWGILVSDQVMVRRRRTLAFGLALLLLLFSYARAGITAAAISCILLCFVARRYKLLVGGIALTIAMAVAVSLAAPPQNDQSSSVSSTFLYKGHQESGVLGSRKSVWDQALSTIREHPWFGIGFGTADATAATSEGAGMFSSTSETTREHGDSFLAIAEGVGIAGLLPFAALILLVVRNVARVWCATRRFGSIRSLAVPFVAILSAGLIHAAFEDWLFAVGYYLCVFFWTLAFMLVDLVPANGTVPALVSSAYPMPVDKFAAVPSAR